EKAEKVEKAEKAEKKAADKAEKQAEKKAVKEEAKAIKEAKEKIPREAPDPVEVMRRSEEFLSGMFRSMDMDVQIEQTMENDVLSINLTGDDMGVLIGKRGQTLDSVQYLVSLVVNRGNASYVRVKVDTENYRERRKATLENLAKNIAFKVKKTRKSVYLDPMNPYERRIIHSALQADPYVTTHSEGEEPNRKVVVTLKKRDKKNTIRIRKKRTSTTNNHRICKVPQLFVCGAQKGSCAARAVQRAFPSFIKKQLRIVQICKRLPRQEFAYLYNSGYCCAIVF
ncbi:MAG: protein jag, partial [Lachnospiraceae bacterium]|nr:protein jag [Lachnospiraceae bacterium]